MSRKHGERVSRPRKETRVRAGPAVKGMPPTRQEVHASTRYPSDGMMDAARLVAQRAVEAMAMIFDGDEQAGRLIDAWTRFAEGR